MIRLIMREVLEKTLKEALKKVEGKRCALMFTGGFDSVLLALFMRQCGAQMTAMTVQFENFNPRTISEATLTAQKMGLDHHILYVTLKEFLLAFKSLPLIIYKPIFDLDLAVAYAALKKYDTSIAGKIIVSGMGSDQWFGNIPFKKDAIDEEIHQQAAKDQGCKFIFPYLSNEMKLLSEKLSSEEKKDKKLLRELVPEESKKLVTELGITKRPEIQIPSQVRQLLIRIYGSKENIKNTKNEDEVLREIVERLWLKESGNKEHMV